MRVSILLASVCGLLIPAVVAGCGDATNFSSAEPTRVAADDNANDAEGVDPNDPNKVIPGGQPGVDDNGTIVGANGIDPSRIRDGDAIAVTEQNSGEAGEDLFDGAVVPSNEELAAACADAAARKEKMQAILFAKPDNYCDWGQNGNLEFDRDNQLVITARREQAVTLDIPANALLCSLSFDFPEQAMRYDDEIFLALDDVVLAASQALNQANELEMKDGLLIYDWSKLVGDDYPINNRDPYFIDADCGANCDIPPTETTGQMKLTIKDETVRKVATRLGGARFEMAKDNPDTVKPMAVKWITIGDNDDDKDCMHEPVNFSVNMTYITP